MQDSGDMNNAQQERNLHQFDAEVGKVLHLMINAIYTNSDTCLRELISNASDACENLRYLAQSDEILSSYVQDLHIEIILNKKENTLSIYDTGIGMTEEELRKNLGSVAHSGTQKFLEQRTGDRQQDSDFIGKFGVGFYSVFMISKNVEVFSCKAGSADVYKWSSDGVSHYCVEKSEEKIRGTRIVVHLDPNSEYLDFHNVKRVVKKYSDYVSVPIMLNVHGDAVQEEDSKCVNSSIAVWRKSKNEVSKQQYEDFYKEIAEVPDSPWGVLHNVNEGVVEFTNLLFLPTNRTFDLFSSERKRRVKLYIKKVFITDEGVDLVPYYLRFLRGVIETDALPLNISRENIQNSPVIGKIRSVIVKRVIDFLTCKLKNNFDEYLHFWSNFGSVLKEGLCEDHVNAPLLLKISLFYSALKKKFITLSSYIEGCKQDQRSIYYFSGESTERMLANPAIEGLLKRDIDVLLLTDTVDSFWVGMINEFEGKKFVSASSFDLGIEKDQDASEANSKGDNDALCKYFKTCLGQKIKDIRISDRLVDSPVCLVSEEGGMDSHMERILVTRKHIEKPSSKILEINPSHDILQKLRSRIEAGTCGVDTEDVVHLMFDQATFLDGSFPENVVDMSNRINRALSRIG
ncbi:molecular chaperone HtpG [Candidatus Sneabacter namystus]|uniref:Chaperone protein HtpG n=1 Tax=Candidatus Sneabacter namystus TaxID=2601646 RepID=A0A5C0UJD8_9RICK|nr:molecular chaperone HtpG [Candidatus Sneabacter namystus]QEK39870.1 molecular chaperone HtpG [Candidatus Sneabacter namystus]